MKCNNIFLGCCEVDVPVRRTFGKVQAKQGSAESNNGKQAKF